jgi:hypothetical protein
MYIAVHDMGADLVVTLDCDEFLVAADNKTHPRDILEKLNPYAVYNSDWRTYFPHETDQVDEMLAIKRIRYYSDQCDKSYGKVMVPKFVVEKYKPKIATGNHSVSIGKRYRKNISFQSADGLRIAHFPIRGQDQLRSKIFIGWINNLSRMEHLGNENWHLKALSERLVENSSGLTIDDLQGFVAFSYLPVKNFKEIVLHLGAVSTPFSESINLRYTPAKPINYLKNLLCNDQEMARQFAALTSRSRSVTKAFNDFGGALAGKVVDIFLGRLCGLAKYKDRYLW